MNKFLLVAFIVLIFVIGIEAYVLVYQGKKTQEPDSSNAIIKTNNSTISPTVSFNKAGFDQHISTLLDQASLTLQWNVLNYMALSKRKVVIDNALEIKMQGSIVNIGSTGGNLYNNQFSYNVKIDVLGDKDLKPTSIYYTTKQLPSVKIFKNKLAIDLNQLKIGDKITITEKYNLKSEKLQESLITVL